eukprot:gnl/Chilomastix_cuspidata/783.p2 GENE.gnl/Chilomastix_cuspidata/783~~gnl/Chilomastix_cuspidata/783.p2  ORF type:complete len:1028 (-),score=341.82 gnl/Chilomastix_cuspidata/783:1586-4669(-)
MAGSISHEEIIIKLSKNLHNIRNVSIIAHVDHGKTTLADVLISSNGLISSHTPYFLDYRDSEIDRLITMKSSCISLYYINKEEEKPTPYLLNLIDSPGHLDFAGEVSAALRITDTVLFIIDAVEGIKAQTRTCFTQALKAGITPILFINKVDRLVGELNLSPAEAFERLSRLVRSANSLAFSIIEKLKGEGAEVDVKQFFRGFEPRIGNVIFGSSLHRWGFSLPQMAKLFAPKVPGISEAALLKGLWGSFFLTKKDGRLTVSKVAKKKADPLFASMCLRDIFRIYEAASGRFASTQPLLDIGAALGIPVPKSIALKGAEEISQHILSNFFPLAIPCLSAVVHIGPSPHMAQAQRKAILFPHDLPAPYLNLLAPPQPLPGARDAPLFAVVSKLLIMGRDFTERHVKNLYGFGSRLQKYSISSDDTSAAPSKTSDRPRSPGRVERVSCEIEQFIAVVRVFSGVLRPGAMVDVIGGTSSKKVQVRSIFLLMGRSLVPVRDASVGMIVGVSGLSDVVTKSATIFAPPPSESPLCRTLPAMTVPPPFPPVSLPPPPSLEVALTPRNIMRIGDLFSGIERATAADQYAQSYVNQLGEPVLVTGGEVHLQEILNDIKEIYQPGIEFTVSDPIVRIRETVAGPSKIISADEEQSCTEELSLYFANRGPHISVPEAAGVLRRAGAPCTVIIPFGLYNDGERVVDNFVTATVICFRLPEDVFKEPLGAEASTEQLRARMVAVLEGHTESKDLAPLLIAVNPSTEVSTDRPIIWPSNATNALFLALSPGFSDDEVSILRKHLSEAFFQMCACGPIAEEPLDGVGFLIAVRRSKKQPLPEVCHPAGSPRVDESDASEEEAPLQPTLITSLFDSYLTLVWKAMMDRAIQRCEIHVREPIFRSDVNMHISVIGAVSKFIKKRRGKIESDNIDPLSNEFILTFVLPVMESFGFSTELLTLSSGTAHLHLHPAGFSELEDDPRHSSVAVDADELEEWGAMGRHATDTNVSRAVCIAVRIQKGLSDWTQMIEFGDKQRTRARKR